MDQQVRQDLDELKTRTAREVPSLESTMRAARSRSARSTKEGLPMFLEILRRRPALATMAATLAVALTLLVIPVSFERTTGFELALSLDGAGLDRDKVMEIASSFKETLGAERVMVGAEMENGRTTYRLEAFADGDPRKAADAFAGELQTLGFKAAVEAMPRKETVSGNVYAYAMNRVIEIRTDGKSAAELEAEIRQRLAEAGVTQAQVSVTDHGNDRREIKINAERMAEGEADGQPEFPQLMLTKDGKPVTGGFGIKVMKKKDHTGRVTLVVKVEAEGKTVNIEIPDSDSIGDAGIASAIRSKLTEAGIDAEVTVQGGEVRVEKREP